MAFQYIASANGQSASSVSTLDTSSSLNVAEGDLLVACVKYLMGTQTTEAVADTDGTTNTFTFDSADRNTTTNTCAAIGYKLAATADSSATFRVTLGAARSYVSIIVLQFRPTSGYYAWKDQRNSSTGSSNSASSGNITTTSAGEVVIGHAVQAYDINTCTNEQINSVTADGYVRTTGSNGVASAFYRIVTATFTGQATSTLPDPASPWVCQIVSFYETRMRVIQTKGGYSTSAGTYYELTFDSNVTLGNRIIAVFTQNFTSLGGSGSHSSSGTFSTLGWYSTTAKSLGTGPYVYGCLRHAYVTGSGTCTVRITSTDSTSMFALAIMEVEGVSRANPGSVLSWSTTDAWAGYSSAHTTTCTGRDLFSYLSVFLWLNHYPTTVSVTPAGSPWVQVWENENTSYSTACVVCRAYPSDGSTVSSHTWNDSGSSAPDPAVGTVNVTFRSGDIESDAVSATATPASVLGPLVEEICLPGTIRSTVEM